MKNSPNQPATRVARSARVTVIRDQLRSRPLAEAGVVLCMDKKQYLPDGSDEAIFLMNRRESPESVITDELPSIEDLAN